MTIDDIRAIYALKKTKKYTDLDILEEVIPTEMIKLSINTLTLDAITLEEEALGYFICKKLQELTTWNKWKDS